MVHLADSQNANWTGFRRKNLDNRKEFNNTNGVDLNSTTNQLETLRNLQDISDRVQLCSQKLQNLIQRDPLNGQGIRLLETNEADCIGVCERDSAVTSIKTMQRFYNFGTDTLMAAVTYMDKFLLKVKIKKRYMSCVAAASFYLAAKMFEEPEDIPGATELSNLHRQCWKPSDLKRMEKVILDKFNWDMYPIATPLSFIELIYSLLKLVEPAINKSFYNSLSERAELYINYSKCANYRASSLALSIVHQCLKTFGYNSVPVFSILLHVQAICKVSDSELFDCQCTLSEQLEVYTRQPAARPLSLPLPKLMPRHSLVFRPSLYGSTDLPTIDEVAVDIDEDEDSDVFSDETVTTEDEEMLCESTESPSHNESTSSTAPDHSESWPSPSAVGATPDHAGHHHTIISAPFLYSEVVSLGRAAFTPQGCTGSAKSHYLSSHCHSENISVTPSIPLCNIIKA